jgi:outer membrane protein assembly factor BamB
MTSENTKPDKPGETAQRKPLRLWPGILIVTLQWLARFVIPRLIAGDMAMQLGVFIGLLCGVAIIVWWIFFSRATRTDRWMGIVLMIAGLFATSYLLHESIATAMMGFLFVIYSVPIMCLAFVIWATYSRNLSVIPRRVTMIITIILSSGLWIFIRTDGMYGDGSQDFSWRWAKTHEQRLLEESGKEPSTIATAKLITDTKAEWPGFRGSNRDGIVRGVMIRTDWSVSPPVEMWRKPVGPGCSSFAVHGNLLYTQEQRGEYENVSCYSLATGEPVWKHQDKVRFYDSHSGAGPRSTPTLEGGRVYALGTTGILNVLDASDGSLIWSRNAASDAGVEVLPWGFTSSPLVVGKVVIIALSGKLAAYDIVSGESRWFGPDGGASYSSPHLLTISEVPQVLLMSKAGAVSIEPSSGKVLWEYSWPMEDRILQPAMIEDGDLLFCADYKSLRRVTVTRGPDGWTFRENWTSTEMILSFQDFVVHKNHIYGFDGPSLVCLDIKNGKRTWKGNRYRGWLLLLADQDLLLMLTEKGDLALVFADPNQFAELAHFPGIRGRTWNHPALAGNIMIVRNAQEMAAFRLPLKEEEKDLAFIK